ncbi:CYFA0S10e01035g1_1 [Cyberlindnera fabianii]|uniref:CYFA0S10e01035g1_1 n=1 Tax=Cyberlindnera fabianii TaxID=36022 RepID=A0A061AZM2_CYBFA|nr:hypothetical protein BON22_3218 [Cyberlindnera fabianii]CDR42677.1 CYFA0S10e01035g1_1 [Cyberlindnera fabianii]
MPEAFQPEVVSPISNNAPNAEPVPLTTGSPVGFVSPEPTSLELNTSTIISSTLARFVLWYPLLILLIPLIIVIPPIVGASLVLRYDESAQSKLIQRTRSVLFLAVLITVFSITMITTFPVWSVLIAGIAGVGAIVSMTAAPFIALATGFYAYTVLV